MAVLGLQFCARAFSSCGKRGPLFIAVHRPLTIAASLVAEHRLQTRRLSNCGSWAQLPRGMWDLPRPGLEPVSPAFAGRFSTTEGAFVLRENSPRSSPARGLFCWWLWVPSLPLKIWVLLVGSCSVCHKKHEWILQRGGPSGRSS